MGPVCAVALDASARPIRPERSAVFMIRISMVMQWRMPIYSNGKFGT